MLSVLNLMYEINNYTLCDVHVQYIVHPMHTTCMIA